MLDQEDSRHFNVHVPVQFEEQNAHKYTLDQNWAPLSLIESQVWYTSKLIFSGCAWKSVLYCDFQKNANSEVQKPTSICIFHCQQSS